jgi:signal transduction histidine kinase
MSAAIAHEINQPLMAIANYAQAARRRLAGAGALDADRLDGLMEKIGEQAALAGKVLDQLRAMVRRREADVTVIDVEQLLANAVRLIEMEGRIKDVRIESSVAAGLPPALGDEIQIQQVILNLARNAMEAMIATPAGERLLRLEATAPDGGGVAIGVSDSGPGIAAADGEKVFDPFYTTKPTGLGVGLAISRAIVEAHGGALWHAPSAGGGTVFRFTLPDAQDGA